MGAHADPVTPVLGVVLRTTMITPPGLKWSLNRRRSRVASAAAVAADEPAR